MNDVKANYPPCPHCGQSVDDKPRWTEVSEDRRSVIYFCDLRCAEGWWKKRQRSG